MSKCSSCSKRKCKCHRRRRCKNKRAKNSFVAGANCCSTFKNVFTC